MIAGIAEPTFGNDNHWRPWLIALEPVGGRRVSLAGEQFVRDPNEPWLNVQPRMPC